MFDFSDSTWALIASYAVKVLGVIALISVAWILAGWARRLIVRSLERAKIDRTLGRFAANAARTVLLILAVLACLSAFGIETTGFSAIIGAAGLAVGLALQGTLANFSAGVMLLVFRPFRVGDEVTVGGITGTVEEIELFSTHLDTPDNRRLIVPNKMVYGTTIEIATHHPQRRIDLTISVDAAVDIERARAILEGSVAAVPGRLPDPPQQVIFGGLNGTNVEWHVRLWCKTSELGAVKQAAAQALKLARDQINATLNLNVPALPSAGGEKAAGLP